MQIKQLTSYINTSFFTPWDYELETQMQLYSQPKNTQLKQTKAHHQNSSIQPIKTQLPQFQSSIEEQAKKNLLNIQTQPKVIKLQKLKQYIDSKQRHNRLRSVLPFSVDEFKLPLLNRKQTLDYNSSLFLGRTGERMLLDEQQIFKKYGEHRKINHKDATAGRVERSSSLNSAAAKDMNCVIYPRKNYSTVEHQNTNEEDPSDTLQNIKLKGKKYQRNSRGSAIFRMGIKEINYLPTQSKITPHAVLFGHNKDDVMKKVLQQIQRKIPQL